VDFRQTRPDPAFREPTDVPRHLAGTQQRHLYQRSARDPKDHSDQPGRFSDDWEGDEGNGASPRVPTEVAPPHLSVALCLWVSPISVSDCPTRSVPRGLTHVVEGTTFA
jgi:hypothetical protein